MRSAVYHATNAVRCSAAENHKAVLAVVGDIRICVLSPAPHLPAGHGDREITVTLAEPGGQAVAFVEFRSGATTLAVGSLTFGGQDCHI